MPGYVTYHNEGNKRGIILKATLLKCKQKFDEMLWMQSEISKGKNLHLGCLYRSPNSSKKNTEI